MASQFHPFPRLPLEIQTIIWTFTLPPPSIHRLHICTIPTDNLALMNRRISYDEERRWRRSAGFHFSSPCCPPALLHISQHTRQLAHSIYQQVFKVGVGQGMGLWYQAVNTFREDWEADVFWEEWESGGGGDERREFFEQEKEVFDEAREYARRSGSGMEGVKQKLRVRKGWDRLQDRSLIYKGKWLERAKRIFREGKRFVERVKGGLGVWYRPGVDVLFLEKDEMRVLAGLVAEMKGEWALGDVKTLAVEECWEGDRGDRRENWRVLFGKRVDIDENADQNEPDSVSDEMGGMPPALFRSLDELTVVVSDGYHNHRDTASPMICIDYPKQTVEKWKEECRLRTLTKLQKNSALTKIPVVKVVRDDELFNRSGESRYGWSKARWDGCHMGHREDCYRRGLGESAKSPRDAPRRSIRRPAGPPPPPPPPQPRCRHYIWCIEIK
ncbi:hypothetical protein V8E51_001125 [Hyaloscypha variabilis]